MDPSACRRTRSSGQDPERRPERNLGPIAAPLQSSPTPHSLREPHTVHPVNQRPRSVHLGLDEKKKRTFRWILGKYIAGPEALNKFKVALPKANGSGAFGEALASPIVLGPATAVADTFITIGAFESSELADDCLKYIKSKFARAMLGMLKVTQDNLARVWSYIPNQDFTASSDIDWSKSIPDFDQQLYAKYGLDADEIAFIEDNVKPME